MKIVQTAWASNKSSLLEFHAGWAAPEYHLMAWCLSCLQLKKHYNEVVLYADSITAKMFIEILKLPYTEVFCELDQLKEFPEGLYALPKIETYSRQETPFLHVDGDVFIWKPFSEELLNGDLIAQNLEVGTALYEGIMTELERNLVFFSDEIQLGKNDSGKIYAYNAGIFGGNDLQFFDSYTREAKNIITKNSDVLSKLNLSALNVYCEQHLFYCMSKKKQKEVKVLFEHLIDDNGYNDFGGLIDVPYNKQYIHLVGQLKRSKGVCAGVAERLRRDYPEYYYRIISLFKSDKKSLQVDHYHFFNKCAESFLTERHYKLKKEFLANQLQIVDQSVSHSNRHSVDTMGIAADASNLLEEIAPNVLSRKKKATMINDATSFEQKLSAILNSKFANYSRDYLYARDLMHVHNIEDVFSDNEGIYNRQIIADELNEIITSKLNWLQFMNKNNDQKKTFLTTGRSLSNVMLNIIPECDLKGYSIVQLDTLDREILRSLRRKPKTIRKLTTQLSKKFDFSDNKSSMVDFEQLILGRIKLAMLAKIIKSHVN